MPPDIRNLQADDVVFVAWIDLNGNCRDERVRVQDTYRSHEGVYIVDLSTDSGSFQLLQLPPDPCIAIDTRDDRSLIDADGDILASPVLGIERDAGLLLLHVLFRVLELGHSPSDALDLIALEFELYSVGPYAALRGVPEEELRAHVDDIISDMAPSTDL